MQDLSEAAERPSILTCDDGATIAYRRVEGRTPGIVFLHGLMSDMTGSKALAVEALARERGQAFLRFDTFGHGASSGDFAQATVGRWRGDVLAALDALTRGPQVIVGSSMGGWLMLLAALARPERIAGLVGIAAAPDATEDLIWGELTREQQQTLMREGSIRLPSAYDPAGYLFTRRLIEEGRDHLLLGGEIPIACPVRLIHGMEDKDVPWRTSLRLAERLATRDVEVTLVKGGDHRLSAEADLMRLRGIVATLLDQFAGSVR
jgi:pimeloyl-ACP methyl ester carboxylesterase